MRPCGQAAAVVALLAAATLAACASGYRPPELIGGDDLVYPPEAARRGIEGQVVVRYDVTAEGNVTNAAVVGAVPPGVFEEAALRAVRSWRFRPSVEHGKRIRAPRRESAVTFRLGGDARYDDLPRPPPAADGNGRNEAN